MGVDLVTLLHEQTREIEALKAELAERRGQYHALFDENPLPTWVYCPESLRFLDVNEAAIRTYGWSQREFLSMTIADIRPAEDVPALVANVAKMRATPSGATGPWRHLHRDGRLVEVTVSFHSLPFAGRAARLIVTHAPGTGVAPLTMLSPREREVFERVARGQTSREIAAALALSPKSVETYRARFMQKLGLKTRTDLLRCALRHGVLRREDPDTSA
jgi:PAS domain S-box-containing protein